jgi:hypothetical protein
MPQEFIIGYLKPGFPKKTDSEKSFRTSLEYVGPIDELEDEKPAIGTSWGTYPGLVSTAKIDPLPGTDHATLKIDIDAFADQAEYPEVQAQEETYERDWQPFSRSLYEHPAFAIGQGGASELTSEDIVEIDLWKNEKNSDLKANYQFNMPNPGSSVKMFVKDLSNNAKLFARGLELGQDTWEDYAPIIRRTTSYANGIASGADAGLKGGEPSFPGKPAGYEWRKSTDSGIRAGGQSRWDQVEEWVGATKVLIDRENIFWSAP